MDKKDELATHFVQKCLKMSKIEQNAPPLHKISSVVEETFCSWTGRSNWNRNELGATYNEMERAIGMGTNRSDLGATMEWNRMNDWNRSELNDWIGMN